MGARIAVLLLAAAVLLAGCDREPAAPAPAPTVPSTLPAEPETEECADLVDAALGLLQGQLDALAGVDGGDLAGPDGTLPALPELDALAAELDERRAGLCADGELGGLLGPRLGELRPRGVVAERYVGLLAERLGQSS